MHPKYPLLVWVIALLLLASCTASEKAARNSRKAKFHAEKAARKKGGKRDIQKHKVGEDPKIAHLARKKKNNRLRTSASDRDRYSDENRAPRTYTSKDVATVIRTARSYLGTPYLHAGTTRIGMDCSGLTMTSYEAISLQLPRNSTEQGNYGSQVPLPQIREGDLVFFGAAKNSSQITHVGLVTDVKNDEEVMFIHSSTTLGVIENNLYSRYYYDRFIKATRPVLNQ